MQQIPGDAAPKRISFDQLADQFMALEVFASPASLHGLLCGLLARPQSLDEQGWLINAATFLERHSLDNVEIKELLLELFASTLADLAGEGFSLDLILPDEDHELEIRAQGLSQWCQGFAAGFGALPEGLSEELVEMLEDLEQIGQLDTELDVGDESLESDLVQLIEYVRMAALYAFSEIHAPDLDSEQQDKPVLH